MAIDKDILYTNYAQFIRFTESVVYKDSYIITLLETAIKGQTDWPRTTMFMLCCAAMTK